MICSDCKRDDGIREIRHELWGRIEERHYICDCSSDTTRIVIVEWPERNDDPITITYYRLQPEEKFEKYITHKKEIQNEKDY